MASYPFQSAPPMSPFSNGGLIFKGVAPPDEGVNHGPKQLRFNPYVMNGGTIAAVAGGDYAIVAADTRISSGYEILSRKTSKLHSLTETCVLGSAGCKTDVDQLRNVMDIDMKVYRLNHRKFISASSVARLLSNTLYSRRLFPYYAFNVLAGIDHEGKGVVCSYDAIGSFELRNHAAAGKGEAYILPLLDGAIGNTNRPDSQKRDLPSEEVVEILKDAFLSAGEREITTGDSIDIWIITKDGTQKTSYNLKAD